MNLNKENLQWSTRTSYERSKTLYCSRTPRCARSTSRAHVSNNCEPRYCTASRCFFSMLLANFPFLSLFLSHFHSFFLSPFHSSYIAVVRSEFGARQAIEQLRFRTFYHRFRSNKSQQRDSYTRADPSLAYLLINYALTI